MSCLNETVYDDKELKKVIADDNKTSVKPSSRT